MYHSISEEQSNGIHPYYVTSTSPEVFARHMQFLRENGYRGLTLEDAVRRLQSDDGLPSQSIVITFDDGYEDFYTHAYPILSQYGFQAAVFLATGYIADTPRIFKDKPCLTWIQIRELHGAGITFGSHTVTHPQLKSVSAESLAYELRQSKATLEQGIGCHVNSFCYPYAFPEQDMPFQYRLKSMLQDVGYEHCLTTMLGVASASDDKFFLKRLPASSRDDLLFLKAKLEGGYDWLHSIQYSAKVIRAKLA